MDGFINPPQYMFQDGFRTSPPQEKSQGNFTFRAGVLNTIAKSSILMSFGGGGD